MSSRDPLTEGALELCWSLWTELGVPGVIRRHEAHAVDVEPLHLLTAQLVDADPRLRDESISWSARNHRFVSRARLRGLLRQDTGAQEAFGPYAAALSAVSPGAWPGATEAHWPPPRTRSVRRTSFEEPALLRLRLRALLGVGARAEIAHAFVAQPHNEYTAHELARLSGFTRANINQELEAFTFAGLVTRVGAAKRWVYRLIDPERLLRFAGPTPEIFVDWVVTLRVVGSLRAMLEIRTGRVAKAVEVAAFLEQRRDDLRRSGFPARPPGVVGTELADWFESAAVAFVKRLARPLEPWRS
jgi:hypothetical protein